MNLIGICSRFYKLKEQKKIKGIVFGRFSDGCNMNADVIRRIIKNKKQLESIPIIYNVEFGHMFPMITLPIGGKLRIDTKNTSIITILNH